MSGEEHKKGRVSELEGQQQASGRAMFLLSGPLREGAKREAGNERGKEPEEKWISLFSPRLARERKGAQLSIHPASSFSTPAALTEEAIGCHRHVILARKENRRGGGREGGGGLDSGREKGGSSEAPVKTPHLRFHSLN